MTQPVDWNKKAGAWAINEQGEMSKAYLASYYGYLAGEQAGIEAAAKVADSLALGFHSPSEYESSVEEAIRALLQDPPVSQPGDERDNKK